jgi:hypothetical protein
MFEGNLLHSAAYLFPVPLIRMVYEANPAAISHQALQGRLHINVLLHTIDAVRYVKFCEAAHENAQ